PFITSGTLQVVNLLGEVIMTHNISNAAKININAEALSKGCYIIKVQSDNKCFAEKFIKQ
ncbi:MAG: T9SS type A sorting domain-containing protein, partial [Bacteroidales bacterium]|nr:T9SS type A sorting domain-containing protein [Bacteroidales bacterium]